MRRVLLALVALLLSFQFSTAEAANRQLLGVRTTQSEKEDLKSRAAWENWVDVIVGLNVPFAPEGTLTPAQVTAQRQEIASAASAVKALLDAETRETVREYVSVPFMAVELSAEQVDLLADSGHAHTLQEDGLNRPALLIPPNGVIPSVPLNVSDTGAGQTIAVIDTGIRQTHEAFGSRVVHQACFSRDNLCEQPCSGSDNGCENGTHVAGIAAGSASGFSGVARAADLLSIRVFNIIDNDLVAWDSDVVSGLEEVLVQSRTRSIAAVSLGFGSSLQTFSETCDARKLALKAAIDNLKSVGVATIAASGNEGWSNSLSSPACISSAVSVSAVSAKNWGNCDYDDAPGDEGPTGPDTVLCRSHTAPFLSLLAPGAPIRSSIPGSASSPNSNNNYGTRAGTAMAAAHVAGAWAVLKQKAPDATVENILGILKSTGVNVTAGGQTFKRIDIDKALQEIASKKIVYTRSGTGKGRITFSAGASACLESCERVFLSGGLTLLLRFGVCRFPGIVGGWQGSGDGCHVGCP